MVAFIIVLLALIVIISVIVQLNKKKIVVERPIEQIVTFSNGCRLNMTLYGKVLSAKIARGEHGYSNAHFLESMTNEGYGKQVSTFYEQQKVTNEN